MMELFKFLEVLKDPALIAMVIIIYLLIRQHGKFLDTIERNTKTLTELATLLNVIINRGMK